MKRLPYGKFNYVVTLEKFPQDARHGISGKRSEIEASEIRSLLEKSSSGPWKLIARNGIYEKLLLSEISDLLMVKMCYAKYLRRIYRVDV
jgi:hypothetical protein